MRDPSAAARLLAELRGADPLAALSELGAWIEAAKGASGREESVRSEVLASIQEAGAEHVSALLGEYVGKATSEPKWNAVLRYARELAGTLCASARILLQQAAAQPALGPAAAAGAARGLHACRTLAKVCFVRYLSVPSKLWRLAYSLHGEADKIGCATMAVRLHAARRTSTSPTHELLRLLMLQASAPDMMAPAQIEAVDRAIEQIGNDFTLRPRGAADNPFCFDPGAERPPYRASAAPAQLAEGLRYFGPGLALDALERLYRQLATERAAEARVFGKDLPPHAQLSAIEHLVAFWGETCPYTPPARTPATGTLQIVRGYPRIWQHLFRAHTEAGALTLMEDGDEAPQAPEAWALQEIGGNELGAEVPHETESWPRCGDAVCVSVPGESGCWLGIVRSMHAESGRGPRVRIGVVSRDPQAVELLALLERSEATYVGEAARQFDFNRVRAIILSDGSGGSPAPNLLLPPENWKPGRVYELTLRGTAHYLHGLQPLRRADDYVRSTFEWVRKPE